MDASSAIPGDANAVRVAADASRNREPDVVNVTVNFVKRIGKGLLDKLKSRDEKLYDAAKAGNVTTAKELIEAHPQVNWGWWHPNVIDQVHARICTHDKRRRAPLPARLPPRLCGCQHLLSPPLHLAPTAASLPHVSDPLLRVLVPHSRHTLIVL